MRKSKIPSLVPLRYGAPYCDVCRDVLRAGMLVAWWRVMTLEGKRRRAVHCKACHDDKVRVLEGRRNRRRGGDAR